MWVYNYLYPKILTYMKKIRIYILIVTLSGITFAQGQNNFNEIDVFFAEYQQLFPRQKIYLHTDKSKYATLENLWYAAFMVESHNMQATPDSSNLYVELLDWNNQVVYSQMLKVKNGFARGDFFLADSLMSGFYQLRAYSEWSLNFEHKLIFTKKIIVHNPNKPNIDIEFYKLQQQANKDSGKVFLSFYPEGGTLLAGHENLVAFQAIDVLNKHLNIQAALFEAKNNKILDIIPKHQGMGYFTFVPHQNKKYFVKIAGSNKKYWLPNVSSDGFSVKLQEANRASLKLTINRSRSVSNDAFTNNAYVFVHRGGQRCFAQEVVFESETTHIFIPRDSLAEGINHLTVFDHLKRPVAERLWFKQPQQITPELIVVKTDTAYQITNLPENHRLAVAVHPYSDVGHSFSETITAYVWLESDLGANIADAQSYLDKNQQYADLLMLTHGWRQFTWGKILKRTDEKPLYTKTAQIAVSGVLRSSLLAQPIGNRSVELTVLNSYNDVFRQKTNKKGRFTFDNLNYNDTLKLLLESRNETGKKKGYFELDTLPQVHSHTALITEYNHRIKRRQFKSLKKTTDKTKNIDRSTSVHSHADHVLFPADYPNSADQNVYDFLRGKVPGLTQSNGTINIRGISSIMGSNAPLVLIDGTPTDISALIYTTVNDVERIDILKNATIYGMRGGNGAIAIYTKSGENSTPGELQFNILGYYTHRQFYTTPINKNYTLWWQTTNNQKKITIPTKQNNVSLLIEGFINNKPYFQKIKANQHKL